MRKIHFWIGQYSDIFLYTSDYLIFFPMNRIDQKILELLQNNCRQSIAEIAEQVNLSTSACHRRVKMLEESGMIDAYCAQLNARNLGFRIQVFVEISLTSQSDDSLSRFEQAVLECPDILECHLMAGEADYLVKLAARSTDHYERIHRRSLSRLPGIRSMKTNFVMRTIQPWKGYSLASAL